MSSGYLWVNWIKRDRKLRIINSNKNFSVGKKNHSNEVRSRGVGLWKEVL